MIDSLLLYCCDIISPTIYRWFNIKHRPHIRRKIKIPVSKRALKPVATMVLWICWQFYTRKEIQSM